MNGERSNRAVLETGRSRAQARPRLTLLLAALAIIAASVTSVEAVDVCMDYTNGGGFAFKRFRAPAKNTCAPLQAFDKVTSGFGFSATACTSSTGKWLILN